MSIYSQETLDSVSTDCYVSGFIDAAHLCYSNSLLESANTIKKSIKDEHLIIAIEIIDGNSEAYSDGFCKWFKDKA